MRGICLGTAADTLGSPATDEYGDTQYCYRTPDGSTTSCPTNYACSLPGPRHGHRALTFKLLGTMATMLFSAARRLILLPLPVR